MQISRLLQALVLLNVSLAIFAACPAGQWNNSGVCTACHWACATCNGGAQTNCLSCAINFFKQPGDTTAPYYCLPTCPAHYYGNNTVGACKICDPSCYWCDFTATNCASCATNYFWTYANPNTCLPCNPTCNGCWQSANNCVACQPGYTYNPDHSCTLPITCHSSCLTCSGPAINQCTSCPSGNFLNANHRCRPCTSPCSECDGPATHCTACVDGYYLSGNTCLPCHADCATCSGPAATDCLSCKPAKPVLVGTGCYPQCAGTTLANGKIKCTTCDPSCKNNNCRDAEVNCVNCKNNYHRENGLCIHNRL